MATKKRKAPSTGAKRPAPTTKKAAAPKRGAPEVVAEAKGKSLPYRGMGYKITPYLFLLFGLVLTVSLVIVHILGMDDGAGAIGYGIQWFCGGLFGGALILLPVLLIFLGLRWCLYNVKWKEADMVPSSEFFEEYRQAKSALRLQVIMASLSFLMISMMFGVVAGYSSPDVAEMWESGAEELFEGGGIIGGMLGYWMTLAFRQVLAMIILVIFFAVCILFTVGLTPDYFMKKLQEKRESAKEQKAYLAAQKREEKIERQKREAAAAAAAAAARRAAPVREAPPVEEPIPEEIYEEEPPAVRETREELSYEDIVAFSEDNTEVAEAEEPAAASTDELLSNLGKDYGGDPAMDTGEYSSLDAFFKSMEAREPAPSEPQKSEETPAAPVDLSELGAEELLADVAEVSPEQAEEAEEAAPEEPVRPYIFPPMDLMAKNQNDETEDFTPELQENARVLVDTLKSFRINIKSIDYSRGPTITRYELRPEAGVRVRSIANLVDDIALSLATSGVRIEAPIPGKPAVGIEVPNRKRATVYLRDLIDNSLFTDSKSKLTASLGMDVGGNPIYFDITKMPHMIIAGATGMGKSVCINSIIISILYKARPDEVKLILIDPKKVEFNLYKDIPHLYAPIVSEPKKAAGALASAVAEMERRFELIEEVGVRDINSYNAATENDPYKEKMPHMVIIIDELADLMMTAPDDVEASICRLAQKARAAGIHIIIGTQRPSVDVITGLIKANIPSRIACTVASQVDSRTIIDIAGAEKLIGRGDMLFAPVGAAKPLRVQGAFVTETEVENICTFIRENNNKAKYNKDFIHRIEEEAAKCGAKKGGGSDAMMSAGSDGDGGDSKFREAVKLAVEEGKISTSLMQRRLGVGYGRAAKIIDTMEQMGYVSKPDGNKPRRVLLTAEEYAQRLTDGTLGDSED